jgi:FkbM family methyltransferase
MDAFFRALPQFKGKQRLAKFLLKRKLETLKDIWIKGQYGCSYLLPNLVENVSREIFINGIYEKATSEFFVNRSSQGGVYLDLGANIGAIAVPLLKRRQDLKVICVEAAPWLFPYLQKNIEANSLQNVVLVNKALFDEDDRELDFYSPDVKFGKGSLSPTYTDKSVKVQTIKVDTLVANEKLPRVDVIKIDVEGYEYQVFKGAERLLGGDDAPDILFEFEDWAEELAKLAPGSAQALLMKSGYKLFRMDANARFYPQEQVLTSGSMMILATKRTTDGLALA